MTNSEAMPLIGAMFKEVAGTYAWTMTRISAGIFSEPESLFILKQFQQMIEQFDLELKKFDREVALNTGEAAGPVVRDQVQGLYALMLKNRTLVLDFKRRCDLLVSQRLAQRRVLDEVKTLFEGWDMSEKG